jgi:hypothetical protein
MEIGPRRGRHQHASTAWPIKMRTFREIDLIDDVGEVARRAMR